MVDENFLGEVSEFLKVPVIELRKRFTEAGEKYPGFLKWIHVSEEEWNERKINQSDEEEVASFYRNTLNYIPELVEYHSTTDKQRLTEKAIQIMRKHECKNVVDYGVGIGQDSIMQSLAGLEATAVDLPGNTFDFAKWRFERRGLEIETIDIKPGEMPLVNNYDAATCFEVIQHVMDPERLLRHFYKHINPNGLLLMTARFKGNYALALKKNERFDGRLSEIVQAAGFRQKDRVHMWGPKNKDGKYLEVFLK